MPQAASKGFIRIYMGFRLAEAEAQGDQRRFRQVIRQFLPPDSIHVHTAPSGRKQSGQVLAIAKPEPNLRLLARALLQLQRELDRAEEERRAA